MATFYQKYKCRLCGKSYHNAAATGNYSLAWKCAFALTANFQPFKEPLSPSLLGIHHCNNGSIGIADFEGWEREQ